MQHAYDSCGWLDALTAEQNPDQIQTKPGSNLIPGSVDQDQLIQNTNRYNLTFPSILRHFDLPAIALHMCTRKYTAMWKGREIPNCQQQLNSDANQMRQQ